MSRLTKLSHIQGGDQARLQFVSLLSVAAFQRAILRRRMRGTESAG